MNVNLGRGILLGPEPHRGEDLGDLDSFKDRSLAQIVSCNQHFKPREQGWVPPHTTRFSFMLET
jgi:hypothetical protein